MINKVLCVLWTVSKSDTGSTQSASYSTTVVSQLVACETISRILGYSTKQVYTLLGRVIFSSPLGQQMSSSITIKAGYSTLVSCPARARLPARSGLVNEVEFLELVTQNG